MADKLVDRRIIKTKNSLRIALINLLAKNRIEEISVVQLANEASINRKTFYLHYPDINAILKEIENELIEKLTAHIKNYDFSFDNLKSFIYNITNTITEDELVLKILTTTPYGRSVITLIGKVLRDYFSKKIIKNNNEFSQMTLDYHIFGSMNIFYNWLKDKNKTISIEKLVEFVYSIIASTFND